jgi:hypothetical protein
MTYENGEDYSFGRRKLETEIDDSLAERGRQEYKILLGIKP